MDSWNNKALTGRNTWRRLTLLCLVLGLSLYLPFRSLSLDDFDAYSFALALQDFDLSLQQPQPPGFPVYIFLGRLLLAFTDNPTAALTLLSALSGVGTILLVYALGRVLDPGTPGTSVGAALWAALLPMTWLTSEKALSDAPGLAITLLALYLLWKGQKDKRWLALGSLTAGLSLGLRPQNALPIFLLLGYLFFCNLKHHKVQRLALLSLCFVIGITVWLLPILQTVGGLNTYMEYLNTHAAHVRRADSLIGMEMPQMTALKARALAFGDTFLNATIGIGLFKPLAPLETVQIIALVTLILCGLAWAAWQRHEVWLLAIWLLTVTAQVFLLEALDRPRLMVPIIPPLVLLVAHGWSQRRRPGLLLPAVLALTSLALLIQGVPLAAQLASVPSPPAQATRYIAKNYPPQQTVIAAAGSFRAIQSDIPAYRLFYLYRFDVEAVRAAQKDNIRYIAIFDRDQFPEDAISELSAGGAYVPLEDRTFSRDRRVHTQHDQVRVQILTPAELVPAKALRLPESGCLDIGSMEDGRYLGQGWYRPEAIGGVHARWAGGTTTATLRLVLETAQVYHVRLRTLAYPAEQNVTLRANKQVIGEIPIYQVWTEAETKLPADIITPGQTITADLSLVRLELIHTTIHSPFDKTEGASSDTRPLAAAYDWICLTPE